MAYAMLLTCALVGLGAHASAPVEVRDSADRVTLTNGFVSVSFNKRSPSIDDIRGDFVGGGAYRVCFALPATWAGGTKVAVGGLAHGANYEVGGLKKPVAADGTGFVRFVLQGNSTCIDLQDHARPQRR